MSNRVPLGMGLHEDEVHQCDHVAYFWETENEFSKAVGFLEIGLNGNDHCVIFGYEEANQKVLRLLMERGFDPDQLRLRNRLSVLTAEHTGEATLGVIGKTFEQAIRNGAPLIRLLGNIGWNRPKWPTETDLLAFEAKVTSAARQFPCVIVCMYDVRALPGRVILRGGLETHPVTIRGNVTRVNPYFLEVEEFLEKMRDVE